MFVSLFALSWKFLLWHQSSRIFQASVARASHVPSSCSWWVRSGRRMPRQIPGMGKSWATSCGCGHLTKLLRRQTNHESRQKKIEAMMILYGGKGQSEMLYIVRFKYAQICAPRISARRQGAHIEKTHSRTWPWPHFLQWSESMQIPFQKRANLNLQRHGVIFLEPVFLQADSDQLLAIFHPSTHTESPLRVDSKYCFTWPTTVDRLEFERKPMSLDEFHEVLHILISPSFLEKNT